jgi:adenosylcobinamide-GDP ribazoletransferase
MPEASQGEKEPFTWPDRPWPRAFFTAVQFLSRIPVPHGRTRSLTTFPEDIRRGVVFFPLIGGAIGTLTACALLGAASIVPWPVAVLMALAAEAIVTGAFHEDAVADFCDAFGGGWTREDTLRILKDSRVGSFGALGLGLAVALRAAALIAIGDPWRAAVVVILAGAVGRLVILIAMVLIPPVADREGLAKDIGAQVRPKTAWTAALLVSPALAWLVWREPGAALGIAFVLALGLWWLRRLVMRRIGGITGDGLGFAAYAGILAVTIGLAR